LGNGFKACSSGCKTPLRFGPIVTELKHHVPFTFVGTAVGILIMAGFMLGDVPQQMSHFLFWTFHPLHVLISAHVTAAMYVSHGGRRFLPILAIGYFGSVGIATVSDSLIPYLGEWMLGLPNRGIHVGVIEKWWLVNPLALIGIGIGWRWSKTRFFHAMHVLLSTWASLFHITMSLGDRPDVFTLIVIAAVLFFSVWIPCCTSDIIFPLLFTWNRQANKPKTPTGERPAIDA
jgi:hypothetical protein